MTVDQDPVVALGFLNTPPLAARQVFGDFRGQNLELIEIIDHDKLEVLPSEVAEDLPGGEWRRIQKSRGYDWILVNGQITFENGEPTGALPAKFLRNGRG